MTDLSRTITVKPIIKYPREAQVGKTYLMTIDLQPEEGSKWQYDKEEYPIYCTVDSDLFKSKSVGEPVIVLHRFGGSYGEVRFSLKASDRPMKGEIKVILTNAWGLPVESISFTNVEVKEPNKLTSVKIDNSLEEEEDSFSSIFKVEALAKITSDKQANQILQKKIMDKVSDIFTPIEVMPSITNDDTVADLYYLMSTGGYRFLPVIDRNNRGVSRIVSRRDLGRVIPPNIQEIQDLTGITINSATFLDLIDDLSHRRIGEIFPPHDLITIKPSESIVEAIKLLSSRHSISGKRAYLKGFPVIEDGKLLGFLSYLDVLKKFIKKQDNYLSFAVREIAKLDLPDEPLYKLNTSHRLSDALMRMDSFGIRSLPVIDRSESNNLVGFVEDVQVMSYSHPVFANKLSSLSVEYFMTPADRLYTPGPKEALRSCIDKFLVSTNENHAPSTLIICDYKKIDNGKKLLGVLSYVDIFRKWLKSSFNSELSS